MTVAANRFNNDLRYREGDHPNQTQFTPSYVLGPVRVDLGGVIGLDPATTEDNPVGAERFYTPAEDGLEMPWMGPGWFPTVFLNPPYSKAREPWVERCIEQGSLGQKVILLIPAATDTRIFQKAAATADAIVFTKGRVKFGTTAAESSSARGLSPIGAARLEHRPRRLFKPGVCDMSEGLRSTPPGSLLEALVSPLEDDVEAALKGIETGLDRLRTERFLWLLIDLEREVARQDGKHGPFVGSVLGRSRLALACLRDEVDEAEQAWRGERKATGWPETYGEVMQVAAVAMRALRDAFVSDAQSVISESSRV